MVSKENTVTIDKGLVSLVWVIGLGAVSVTFSLIAFDLLRPRIPDVYDRRRRVLPRRILGYGVDDGRHDVPPAPSFRPFGWIRHTLEIPDEAIVATHGLDTVMLLRFYRVMAQLSSTLSIFAVIVLFPMYGSAANKNLPVKNPLRVFGLRILSLSNVPAKNWRMIAVFVADVIITALVLRKIALEVTYLTRVRRDYRASEHPSNYTLIVQDIPLGISSHRDLDRFWRSLFPSALDSVRFVPQGGRLERYRQEYWKAVRSRQRAEVMLKRPTITNRLWKQISRPFQSQRDCGTQEQTQAENWKNEPSTKPVGETFDQVKQRASSLPDQQPSLAGSGQKSSGFSGLLTSHLSSRLNTEHLKKAATKFNSIDTFPNWVSPEARVNFWQNKELDALNRANSIFIRPESHEREDCTRAAVVVMRSKQDSAMVAQTNFSTSQMEWSVSHAPDVNALNWGAFGTSARMAVLRKLLALGLTTGLILFWVIPTAIIQSLANIQELSKLAVFSWLRFVNRLGLELSGFIQGLLPAMVLEVVMIIVPKLIRRFVMMQRIPSKVEVEREVLKKMIAFLYFSHLIYVVLSGSLLEYADEIIQNPSNIVSLMSTSIPQQGTFMMNVVLLAAIVQTPISLLQPMRVAKRWLRMRRALTKRDRELVNNAGSVANHFEQYAFGTIFTVLGMVYSTLSPLLLCMVTAFFFVSYTAQRYALIYTHTKEWEGFAALHDVALQGVMFGLVLKHVTMMGLMGLNGRAVLAGLEFGCAALVIVLKFGYMSRLREILEHGALTDLGEVPAFNGLTTGLSGADTGQSRSEEDTVAMAREVYQHPTLQPLEQFEDEI